MAQRYEEECEFVANCPIATRSQNIVKIPPVKGPRARPKQSGGYDCEFVNEPPTIIQTECSICLQILRTPKIIDCCGHSFCAACIDRIVKDGKCCPLCNTEDYTLVRNKALERSLNDFDVKCNYFQEGCCWVGKLGQLHNHLNENDSDSSAVCSFVEVKCSHKCRDYFERRSIRQHEENECLKRPFSCDYCRDYSSTFEDVVYNHYPVCSSYPMSCPNMCDLPYAIERVNLTSHVDNDCPLTVVDCDFHYAGCAVRLPRKDMPDHLRESITHLSLMATKLIEKDKQITTLTNEIMERQYDMERQLCSLREENKALKLDIAELGGRKLDEQTKVNQTLKKETSVLLKETTESKRTPQSMSDRLQHNARSFEEAMDKHKDKVSALWFHSGLPPCKLIMTNFKLNTKWYSQPFYSHPRGYKMCLNVNTNGPGSHISVFVLLMRGEFDDHLKWPFRGDITIQLLNQREEGHVNHLLDFDVNSVRAAGRVTDRKRAGNGYGFPQFIAHSELEPFLQDNSLHFCILNVEV